MATVTIILCQYSRPTEKDTLQITFSRVVSELSSIENADILFTQRSRLQTVINSIKTDFFVVMDLDDYPHDDCFDEMYEYLEDNWSSRRLFALSPTTVIGSKNFYGYEISSQTRAKAICKPMSTYPYQIELPSYYGTWFRTSTFKAAKLLFGDYSGMLKMWNKSVLMYIHPMAKYEHPLETKLKLNLDRVEYAKLQELFSRSLI